MTNKEKIENKILKALIDWFACPFECTVEDMDCSRCTLIMQQIIKTIGDYENDILKEFVKWLKVKYKKDGLVMAIDDINRMLDQDLEDFIKEKSDENNR